jgi:hypothetical protein
VQQQQQHGGSISRAAGGAGAFIEFQLGIAYSCIQQQDGVMQLQLAWQFS